jgi:hypothetical protein
VTPLQVAIKIYHHYAAISHQVFECIQQTGAYRRRLHNLSGGGAKIYIFILTRGAAWSGIMSSWKVASRRSVSGARAPMKGQKLPAADQWLIYSNVRIHLAHKEIHLLSRVHSAGAGRKLR